MNYTRDAKSESAPSLYTFFVNNVSEEFRYPLIGFINTSRGNHIMPQIGFVNANTGNFTSLQLSFINTVGGGLNGFQGGFVNTTGGDTRGVQYGFINTTAGDTNGMQTGFINTATSDLKGLQTGFINTSRFFNGAQVGFVNTALRGGYGLQAGFVNVSRQKLKGVQLGFVNYADSIEDGIPIGFISIVRHGGYKAVEYSFSDFYPVTMGLKFGVDKFYTSVYLSYDSTNDWLRENIASGVGMGSIVHIAGPFFFNPEFIYMSSPLYNNNWLLLSFVPSIGLKLGKHFSFSAGPSASWMYAFRGDTLPEPLFRMYEYSFSDRSILVAGLRASVRFLF